MACLFNLLHTAGQNSPNILFKQTNERKTLFYQSNIFNKTLLLPCNLSTLDTLKIMFDYFLLIALPSLHSYFMMTHTPG